MIKSRKLLHNSTFQIGREGEKASFVNIVATSPSIEVLNRAKFVASFTSGDYGYFLFQEIEFSTGDRVNKVSTVRPGEVQSYTLILLTNGM